jgi:hypothetical protein
MKKLNFSSEPYKSAAATALIMTKNKETPSLFIIAKSFLNLLISHFSSTSCGLVVHSLLSCLQSNIARTFFKFFFPV